MGIEPRQPLPPVEPWTQRQMFEIASGAVGAVIRDDLRGITKLSVDQIAAMAMSLIALGLIATPPGEAAPATLIYCPKPASKEATDGQ
jgi:hypothetical protein